MAKSTSKITPKYWFYVGLIVFLLSSLGSGIATFDTKYIGDSVYGIVDWLAACIPYFFYGALGGLVIDAYLSKKRKIAFNVPLWSYYTIAFIIISIGALAIHLSSLAWRDILLYFYFPFHYAIFFPGYAYMALPANPLSATITLKLTLDIIMLSIFSKWIYLRFQSIKGLASRRQQIIEKYALGIIFFVLTVGMFLCANNLN
jgi:hypothetical protein